MRQPLAYQKLVNAYESMPYLKKKKQSYYRHLDAVRHMKSLFDTSRDEGYQEGMSEGYQEGMAEGLEKGIKKV